MGRVSLDRFDVVGANLTCLKATRAPQSGDSDHTFIKFLSFHIYVINQRKKKPGESARNLMRRIEQAENGL